jgi:hypothetical protein
MPLAVRLLGWLGAEREDLLGATFYARFTLRPGTRVYAAHRREGCLRSAFANRPACGEGDGRVPGRLPLFIPAG